MTATQNIDKPHERRPFKGHGHMDVVTLGDFTLGRGVFEPGWRWSNDVKPIAGTESCQVHHTGMCLSGRMTKMASSSFRERTEKRLALAGNPGNLRVADWLGIKAVAAIVGGALFLFLFGVLGVLDLPAVLRIVMGAVGLLFGYTIPEFWLGGRVKKRNPWFSTSLPPGHNSALFERVVDR